MTNYQTPVTNRNELVNFWISAILCDSVGHVWTAHQGGVSCYDLQQRAFVHLPFQEMVRVSAYAFGKGRTGNYGLARRTACWAMTCKRSGTKCLLPLRDCRTIRYMVS